jgi:hypothetical protein
MNRSEIQAITLMLLHIWMDACHCEWYTQRGLKCSRCFTMKKAEESMPLIYQAFTNTINEREKGVTHGLS